MATWWPAAGVAVVLIVLSPRSWWPALAVGIAVSSGLANLTAGRTLELSVLFGLANAAEALVTAAFLRRRRRRAAADGVARRLLPAGGRLRARRR